MDFCLLTFLCLENKQNGRIYKHPWPGWIKPLGCPLFFQKTREGCGCPKFLAGKVFRQISTLLENSSPIFRQHEMLSLPRSGHFPARKTAAGKLAAPAGTLLDFLLRDRHSLLEFFWFLDQAHLEHVLSKKPLQTTNSKNCPFDTMLIRSSFCFALQAWCCKVWNLKTCCTQRHTCQACVALLGCALNLLIWA